MSAPAHRGVWIRDDRGERVRLIPLRRARYEASSPIPQEVWDRIIVRCGWPSRLDVTETFGCMLTAACMLVLFPFAIAVGVLLRSPRTGVWLQLGLVIAVGLLLRSALVRNRLRRNSRVVVSGFLAENYCPACAYGLAGVGRDPDGHTTCPECGAAWKLSEASDAAR